MSGLKFILAIVDPTQSAPQIAMQKAAVLALASGASVELVLCHPPQALPAPNEADARHWTEWQSLLTQLAEPMRLAGILVTTVAISGHPHNELLAYVSASSADLVIKGTHGHTLAKRVFSHSTDGRLIQICPAPLLLAKPRPWSTTPVIMAAINPMGVLDPASRRDTTILSLSESFACWLKGDLHIVHAYTPAVVPQRGTGFFGVPAVDAVGDACAERECRVDVLHRFIVAHGLRHRQLHVDMGSTAQYVKRMSAVLFADMVVIGASPPVRNRMRPSGRLAHRIFDALACDVLLVRERS
jgi:universal stress protein E